MKETPGKGTAAGRMALALERIGNELPALLGGDAAALEAVRAAAAAWDGGAGGAGHAVRLTRLVAAHPMLRERVQGEMVKLALWEEIAPDLRSLAEELGVESTLPAIEEAVSRVVDLTVASVEGAARVIPLTEGGRKATRSIKLSNLTLNPLKLAGLLAEGVLTVAGGAASWIVAAAGILKMLLTLVDAMSVEVSAEQASVYWGLLRVQGEFPRTGTGRIVAAVNAERARFGLPPLPEEVVGESLLYLESIGSIERLDGAWQVVEQPLLRRSPAAVPPLQDSRSPV